MEAATQPQAYEHSQTIFGLAVARPLVHRCFGVSAFVSALFRRFFCEIANKHAVCFGVSALGVSLTEDMCQGSLSSR